MAHNTNADAYGHWLDTVEARIKDLQGVDGREVRVRTFPLQVEPEPFLEILKGMPELFDGSDMHLWRHCLVQGHVTHVFQYVAYDPDKHRRVLFDFYLYDNTHQLVNTWRIMGRWVGYEDGNFTSRRQYVFGSYMMPPVLVEPPKGRRLKLCS